jgi:hypothetical protein
MEMRFVAKAQAGIGWRIWDNKIKTWWGQIYDQHPEKLIAELNGEKRPDELTKLGQTKEVRKSKNRSANR